MAAVTSSSKEVADFVDKHFPGVLKYSDVPIFTAVIDGRNVELCAHHITQGPVMAKPDSLRQYKSRPKTEHLAAFLSLLSAQTTTELRLDLEVDKFAQITMKMDITPAMLEVFSNLITEE